MEDSLSTNSFTSGISISSSISHAHAPCRLGLGRRPRQRQRQGRRNGGGGEEHIAGRGGPVGQAYQEAGAQGIYAGCGGAVVRGWKGHSGASGVPWGAF